jgi:hypothetical protein
VNHNSSSIVCPQKLPSIARRFKIDQTCLEKNQVGRVASVAMFAWFVQLLTLAFHWVRAGLSAGSVLVVVGHCCACNYRSAAGRGDDHRHDRHGDCAWCVFTFVFIGEGTPAPFDPPRKLMIPGPYRVKRWMPRKVRSKN